MKRKYIITIIFVILAIIVGRIIYVNMNYEGPEKSVYTYGKECIYNDFSYRISSFGIYDNIDEIKEFVWKTDDFVEGSDTSYVVIGVDVTYVGSQEKANFFLRNLRIQSGAWTNGIYSTEQLKQNRELLRGQTKTLYFMTTVSHVKYAISHSTWNNLENRKFELVLSTYPDIIIMECN